MNLRWERVRWLNGKFISSSIMKERSSRAQIARELKDMSPKMLVLRPGKSWLRLGNLAHWVSWVEEEP